MVIIPRNPAGDVSSNPTADPNTLILWKKLKKDFLIMMEY